MKNERAGVFALENGNNTTYTSSWLQEQLEQFKEWKNTYGKVRRPQPWG